MELTSILKKNEHLLELPVIGEGCFARVFEYDETTVLKVTCCQVTQRLFASALANPTRWPEGLPQVKAGLGVIAKSDEGQRYHGYLVERLFTEDEWFAESRGARAVTRSRAVRGKAGVASPAPGAETGRLREVAQKAALLQPDPDTGSARAQVAFALEMAAALEGPLRDGFLFLAEFMERGGVAFDLTTPGNLRLDCYGRVKLCDPASYAGSQAKKNPQAVYVMCDVPVAVNGFLVKVKPSAVRAKSAYHALEISEACKKLGLTPAIGAVLKVQEHLNKGMSEAKIFAFPDAARRISSGCYAKALAA